MPPPHREPKRYYAYILGSLSGTIYVGVTNSITRRIEEHKHDRGSEFTAKYKVDRLVYFESFQYVNNAIAREKEMKGWRRSKKVALIESVNPTWRDLAQNFGQEFRPAGPASVAHRLDPQQGNQPFSNRDSSLRSE